MRSSLRRMVSIASRVVPGTSETITRSCPRSAFSSDDLPTFGRPRIATRIASSPTCACPSPGSSSTIRSSRSPVPWPCSAERGKGSPSPSLWNSTASRSRRGSSILFASTSTGFFAARSVAANSSSPGVIPWRVSTTKRTRSASSIAARACLAIDGLNGSVARSSTPPVSISRKCLPFQSAISSFRSRVTPGVSCTTAWRVSVSRLISVDLPTFGKPTMATVPMISGVAVASLISEEWRCAGGRARGSRPARRAGRGCAPGSRPRPRGIPWRPWGDPRSGSARPRPPRSDGSCRASTCGAVDRGRDDRYVLLDRRHRGARLHLPGNPGSWRVPST